jgi:hypothetical protein
VTSDAEVETDRIADAFAILYGVAVALVVHGYQFGRGNHTVYLLDPLRRAYPDLLANDWFTTQTLQYHTIFGWLSAALMKVGLIEEAFVGGYVALIVLFNVAWFLIVRALGGSRLTFLVSVLLYYLSAAGMAMGFYQFIQDSAFLPSNVSSVAMLWGIYLWMTRRYAWAGAALGIAGVFHLNHAVVGIGLWFVLSVWGGTPLARRGYWIGAAVVAVLCLGNIALAMSALASRSGRMPLEEFVALYVKLRHPHHYDPRSWPPALWVSFLWPLPFAFVMLRTTSDARRATGRVFVTLSALIVVALICAGLTFVSESLVQMSLYRFSIYIKLLSVVAAAYVLCESPRLPRAASRALIAMLILVAAGGAAIFGRHAPPEMAWHRAALALFVALSVVPAAYALRPPRVAVLIGAIGLALIPIVLWTRLGMAMPRWLDPEYLEVCAWARDNTPKDAIFLVPPDEEPFRLNARRAIVVNFKSVPQLSGELPEWRRRLERVLDDTNLAALPQNSHRPMHATLDAIRQRYDSRSGEHLFAVAREFGARYVVVGHVLEAAYNGKLVFVDVKEDFYVYDLAAGE